MTAIESTFLNLAYPPRLDLGPQLTHEQLLSSMQSTGTPQGRPGLVVRVWVSDLASRMHGG
jgi:hypothetical protein